MGARIHKYNQACSTKPKYKSCLFFFSYSTCCNLQQYRVREFAIFICKSFVFSRAIISDRERESRGKQEQRKNMLTWQSLEKLLLTRSQAHVCVCAKIKPKIIRACLMNSFCTMGQSKMQRTEGKFCEKKKKIGHTLTAPTNIVWPIKCDSSANCKLLQFIWGFFFAAKLCLEVQFSMNALLFLLWAVVTKLFRFNPGVTYILIYVYLNVCSAPHSCEHYSKEEIYSFCVYTKEYISFNILWNIFNARTHHVNILTSSFLLKLSSAYLTRCRVSAPASASLHINFPLSFTHVPVCVYTLYT